MEKWKKLPQFLMHKRAIGNQYEKIALSYLKQNGLKLIQQNYWCRFGEIDLIMQSNNSIVFVEVRFRKNINYGHPLETINLKKQIKIKKTASYYLQQKQLNNSFCRFDAVSIDNQNGINWVKNAFE